MLAVDARQEIALSRGVPFDIGLQERRGKPLDVIERRAQLVGDHRDELVFQTLDRLTLGQVVQDMHGPFYSTSGAGDSSIADLSPDFAAGCGWNADLDPTAHVTQVHEGADRAAERRAGAGVRPQQQTAWLSQQCRSVAPAQPLQRRVHHHYTATGIADPDRVARGFDRCRQAAMLFVQVAIRRPPLPGCPSPAIEIASPGGHAEPAAGHPPARTAIEPESPEEEDVAQPDRSAFQRS